MKRRKSMKGDKWFYDTTTHQPKKGKRMAEAKKEEVKEVNNTVVKRERLSLAQAIGARYSMEAGDLVRTLRESIFPVHKDGSPATDTEMIAFLAICHEHNMNPFVGEIYPYVSQTGAIKTIISVDGWLRKINEHPMFNGMTFEEVNDDKTGKPISITIKIYRKDREHPTIVPERFDECFRDTPPWKQMPHRMLRHKAVRQGARYAFGFASTYDEDYYDEIHVGSGTSESIANATAEKTKVLKGRLAGAKDATGKQVEIPLMPSEPQKEVAQATVPPPPAQPERAEAGDKTAPPAPEPPTPEQIAAEVPGDAVISKADRDALVAVLLEKPGVTKEEAQGAMKATLSKYGYQKTVEIKYRDYAEILEWAKGWEPEI